MRIKWVKWGNLDWEAIIFVGLFAAAMTTIITLLILVVIAFVTAPDPGMPCIDKCIDILKDTL